MFSAEEFLEDLICQVESLESLPTTPELLDKLKALLKEYREIREFDFREIGDHLYDGIYLTDGDGKTIYVNKAYSRITGIRSEEVLGKSVAELMEQGLYKNAVTPEVLKQKRQVNSVAEITRSGTKMLITGNPIFDEQGQIKKVVVIDREITDLMSMRAELEASQQKMLAVEENVKKASQEVEHLRKLQFGKTLFGDSKQMRQVKKQVEQIADTEVTVIITGETGVGKEVVANEIHLGSRRSQGPFIKVNCAAIPATLLESELFGYEKGAFTGAVTSGRLGMFELANNGTILLDEIADMPMQLQSKLLRVIQHKEVTRLGGKKPITLNVRFIAATNVNLLDYVQQGKFREDLYYRLHVFPINIPPLRERPEDIKALTQHFLSFYNAKYNKMTCIDHSGLEMLKHYTWPGNARELQNIIERLVIISDAAAVISSVQIDSILHVNNTYNLNELMTMDLGLRGIVENVERKTIQQVLASTGSTRKAAKILKIDQSTIVKKAKKLGLSLKTDEF